MWDNALIRMSLNYDATNKQILAFTELPNKCRQSNIADVVTGDNLNNSIGLLFN